MSVKISKVYTRPNTETPWHYEIFPGDAFLAQFNNVHLVNCISRERTTIDDLTVKFSIEWNSDESYQAYLQDSILREYWANRDEYNDAVGILPQEPIIEHTV